MTAFSQVTDQVVIPRLAIIDDAEFDQMLYARLIARTGLVGETISFLSAEEAIAYFETSGHPAVNVILLDINMPGMSGFEFLEHASKSGEFDYTQVVIVMLTTSLDPSDIKRAKQFSLIKDCIQKPLKEAHLVRISELLLSVQSDGDD